MVDEPDVMQVSPVRLQGTALRLEPLSLTHVEALAEVALDPELWRLTPSRVETRADLEHYVERALAEQRTGRALPFATIDLGSERIVGSTRYMSIDAAHRRLEIGATFLAPPWQRTAINTEAKYLMLRHAFETLGAVRVELKTDAHNQRSRQAILRLGAREEGTFRKHMRTEGGRWRDTVWFAIVDDDWPAVRQRLERMLAR